MNLLISCRIYEEHTGQCVVKLQRCEAPLQNVPNTETEVYVIQS